MFDETALNVFETVLPRLRIAAIAATAMRAAIRPYSIAVAALLFFTNFLMKVIALSFAIRTSTWPARTDLVHGEFRRTGVSKCLNGATNWRQIGVSAVLTHEGMDIAKKFAAPFGSRRYNFGNVTPRWPIYLPARSA